MQRLLAAIALLALVAGCLDGPAPGAIDPPPVPKHPRWHVLEAASEPEGVEAPTFRLLGAIARTGPVYGGGEPSVWAHLDGSLYVAFPGCDRGFYLVGLPTQESCEHGLVYRSGDDGASWTRLNRDGDGRYEDNGEGPGANGDAEVAVDAAGTVYVSNLGGGIQVHKSTDQGATWTYIGNVVEEDEFSDRQWMAAGRAGHLIVAWMGSGTDLAGDEQGRAVVVNSTFDGGLTWTGALALGSNIGWLGQVAFAPDGSAYLPFTQVESSGTGAVLYTVGEVFSMQVARTFDGGWTWDVVDTGIRIATNTQGGHWSGVNMAPALDVTGDGTVIVAWSEDVNSPGQATATGAALYAIASTDDGATWSDRHAIGRPPTAIMPWVTGGAGDRFAVTYFASDVPLDPDYTGGVWSVIAEVVDGITSPGGPTSYPTVIEAGVHQGAICSRGGACLLSGSDRALLDFFEADVLPDGRLVVAYPADPLQGGKFIEIRVAIQDGGTPLLLRPAQP
jgi:hypothetical protein